MQAAELAALAQEVRQLEPRAGATTVVVIDGPSGSGKSTFATRLAEATGAGLLRLEDMYPGWDGLDEGAQRLVVDGNGTRFAHRTGVAFDYQRSNLVHPQDIGERKSSGPGTDHDDFVCLHDARHLNYA